MPPNISFHDVGSSLEPLEPTLEFLPLTTSSTGSKTHDHDSTFSPDVATVSLEDVTIGNLLGTGAFASVYEIVSIKSFEPQVENRPSNDQDSCGESSSTSSVLVLKRLRDEESCKAPGDKGRRDLANEVDILSRLNHINIIRVYARAPDFSFIVLERLVEDLHAYLKRERSLSAKNSTSRSIRDFFSPSRAALEQQERIRSVVLGIARGVTYLHKNKILHRDIKPDNIGIDALGTIKLMDFASARVIDVDGENDKGQNLPDATVGTYLYMAPEVYKAGSRYSFPADVYSFSVVAWEIVTLMRPFPYLRYNEQIQRCVLEGKMRPPLRPVASKAIREMLKKGWHHDPDKAPSMETILQTLEREVAAKNE